MSQTTGSRPEPPAVLTERVARVLRPRSPDELQAIESWAQEVIEWQQKMPTLSSDMPDYVADELEFEPTSPEYQSPERLESIADYAATLAEWKLEQEAPSGDGGGSGDQDGDGGALSEEEKQELTNRDDVDLNEYDVPQKAYLVKKEVDNNLYYYYQWRKGPSQWGSKYICPVNPV